MLISRIRKLGWIKDRCFRLFNKFILLVLLFSRCLFFNCMRVLIVLVNVVCLVSLFVLVKVFFLKGIVIFVFLLLVLKKVFSVLMKLLMGVNMCL